MAKNYIAVAGNIGVGKSSLVNFLCSHFQIKPFYEPNEINPYLADFYKDMKKWAYHSQMCYLSHKFRIHQELGRCPETVVQDRTIYEDAEVFCTNLFKSGFICKRDFDTYMEMYRAILKSLPPPNLMIYLKCSVRSMKRRIAMRGRNMEKTIPTPYLQKLDRLYERWLSRYDASPLITISTERMDYLSDFIDRKGLLDKIEKYIV